VDRGMFAELVAAEKRLGPPEPSHVQSREIEVEPWITVTTTMSRGSRRKGFETLRDVVTKHRRRWAERHLDAYLGKRAERDVRGAAEQYHKKMAERGGKPPTPRQFVETARGPANRWFGGDVAALYRAFGEKSPVSPEYARRVPADAEAFVRSVYSALGGIEVGPYPDDYTKYEEHGRKVRENRSKARLASMALDYLQLEEALGSAPTLQRFGKGGFAGQAEAVFGTNADEAWERCERIVRDALEEGPKTVPEVPSATANQGEQERRKVNATRAWEDTVRAEDSDRRAESAETTTTKACDMQDPVEHQPARRSWWRRLLDRRSR
jgi:hypothetical protein